MKVFGITGVSGSGKTTLIEKLIPLLRGRGLRVSLIKHSHHGFDIDRPGKDSYRMREAGAEEVLIASDRRWVLMHELRGEPEPILEQQLARLASVDLVLIEGYKRAPMPKIEVWRSALGQAARYSDDASIVGLAVDGDAPAHCALPVLQLTQPERVADFVLEHALAVTECDGRAHATTYSSASTLPC